MPYPRRFRPKRRRMRRIRRRIPRPRKKLSNVCNIVASYFAPNLTYTGTSDLFFGRIVTLSGLSDSGTYDGVFDEYRIMACKVTFIPEFNVFQASSTNAIALPMIYTCLDFNSAATPGSPTEIIQYRTARRKYFNRPHSRYFKPRSLTGLTDETDIVLGTGNLSRKTWISTAFPQVPHFGIRGCVTTPGTSAPQTIKVLVKLYLQFRHNR